MADVTVEAVIAAVILVAIVPFRHRRYGRRGSCSYRNSWVIVAAGAVVAAIVSCCGCRNRCTVVPLWPWWPWWPWRPLWPLWSFLSQRDRGERSGYESCWAVVIVVAIVVVVAIVAVEAVEAIDAIWFKYAH